MGQCIDRLRRENSTLILLLAAFGMLAGLIAIDITKLMSFHEMVTPIFIGTTLGHISAVITAYVGGRLIPKRRDLVISDKIKTTDELLDELLAHNELLDLDK